MLQHLRLPVVASVPDRGWPLIPSPTTFRPVFRAPPPQRRTHSISPLPEPSPGTHTCCSRPPSRRCIPPRQRCRSPPQVSQAEAKDSFQRPICWRQGSLPRAPPTQRRRPHHPPTPSRPRPTRGWKRRRRQLEQQAGASRGGISRGPPLPPSPRRRRRRHDRPPPRRRPARHRRPCV
jgi:hypothetical protein